VIEDCGVRREACNGQLADVPLEGAAIQQIAVNIVEPQALTTFV
jgi:hypothetical protein